MLSEKCLHLEFPQKPFFYLDNPYKKIFALRISPKNFYLQYCYLKYKLLRKFLISDFYSKNSKYPRFFEKNFTKLLIITLRCPDEGTVNKRYLPFKISNY